jgi:class 3 adenylate cyclase
MADIRALLITDHVDSTALASALGDAASSALGAAHDRVARELLQTWHGQEIDRTDGLFLLFRTPRDAVAYALDYHAAMAGLEPPIRARAGIHVGPVIERATDAAHVARGAKPIEIDGIAKPIAARVTGLARPGQTLLTAAARDALGAVPWP